MVSGDNWRFLSYPRDMSNDYRDIWEYFLNLENKKKKKPTERAIDQNDNENEYFLRNFEKYLPKTSKDSLSEENTIKKSRSHSFNKPRATLDLHGKTVSESLELLKKFCINSINKQYQLILIIVGKGIHSEGGKAILQEAVMDWIHGKGKKFVSSYRKAPQKLGGGGAILISLKSTVINKR